MKREWVIRGAIVIGVPITLFAILFVLVVYSPTGMGESRTSPDGLYEASAWNMQDRSWDLERRNYIHIVVKEIATGRSVWDIRRYHQSGDQTIPDYSIRGVKSVEWAPTSTEVAITVENGQTLILKLP